MKSFKPISHTLAPFALALAAALALPAVAQNGPPVVASDPPSVTATLGRSGTEPNTFTDLDTNRDGMLTRDEVVGDTQLSRDFDKIDVDRDGAITRLELKAYMDGRH